MVIWSDCLLADIEAPQFTPSPLNLFMNIPVHSDFLTISFEPPTSRAGQYVSLKAEVDLVIAFSACPQVFQPFLFSMQRLYRTDTIVGHLEDKLWGSY